jgi:hypothetical protein
VNAQSSAGAGGNCRDAPPLMRHRLRHDPAVPTVTTPLPCPAIRRGSPTGHSYQRYCDNDGVDGGNNQQQPYHESPGSRLPRLQQPRLILLIVVHREPSHDSAIQAATLIIPNQITRYAISPNPIRTDCGIRGPLNFAGCIICISL